MKWLRRLFVAPHHEIERPVFHPDPLITTSWYVHGLLATEAKSDRTSKFHRMQRRFRVINGGKRKHGKFRE